MTVERILEDGLKARLLQQLSSKQMKVDTHFKVTYLSSRGMWRFENGDYWIESQDFLDGLLSAINKEML